MRALRAAQPATQSSAASSRPSRTRRRWSAIAGREQGDDRQPGERGDDDRDVRRDHFRERARGREAESLQRDQPRRVDAEHTAEQVLGRDFEDQRVLTEHPGAAERRCDEQRQRDRQPGLRGEPEQRDERGRGEHARSSRSRQARRHEPDGRRARPRSCPPGSRRATSRRPLRRARGERPTAPPAPRAPRRTWERASRARARAGCAGLRARPTSRRASLGGHWCARPGRPRPRAARAPSWQDARRGPSRGSSRSPAASAPRGDVTVIRTPPAALPTTWADWATMRKSERPAMNDSGGQDDRRSACCACPRRPARSGRGRRAGRAAPEPAPLELAMSATIAAESRSQAIIRRRGGTRSTRLESNAPLNRYGTNASVNVTPARNGEAGALEDEHRERDRRHDVAEHRDGVGREQRPELARPPARRGSRRRSESAAWVTGHRVARPRPASPAGACRTACGGTRRSRRRS